MTLGGDNEADFGCRISEIEAKIGGGLIEEVVQVAEGEYKLISTMVQSKV